ncbi:MAG: PQQ-binding-like beta-propeller repeat protein [Planctomycetota bacterium]|nr:PQQ-binding-like beta-propeller repeat protein [Planctomycetota bacterium]
MLAALRTATLILTQIAGASVDGGGQRWPDFRGPTGDGHAPDAEVPLEWSEDENVAWKTLIHGRGWSSPVVWDGQIWLTTATPEGDELSVLALDAATGKVLHDDVLFDVPAPQRRNAMNSHASPSPVIEEGRVYVHFGSAGTACLDTKSRKTLWERRDLSCDHIEGPGSSPILFEDLLIFHMDGGDVQYVVALDKRTGKTSWKTERSVALEHLVPDRRKAYGTPLVVDTGERLELVCSGAEATMAYDPRTGEELWKVLYAGWSMASRPIVGDGLVYFTTGYLRPRLLAVRPGGSGDVTGERIAWSVGRRIPTMPSPILVDGRVYVVSNGGMATCLDAKTGDEKWRARIGGETCASPVYASGRIYFCDRDGMTRVVRPGDELETLATNHLDDGFMASPAVLGNALILRTTSHLYRIEESR